MAKRIVWRGNTVTLSFTFYDENDDIAICTSATVTLVYTGGTGDFETETLDLVNADNVWSVSWDSTAAKAGWAEYHAHAVASGISYAEDSRFRVRANRASYDHDTLPTTGTASTSAVQGGAATDYGETP